MSDTKFNIPESLEIALIKRQVVPFTGAGVSMSVKKSPLQAILGKDGNERKDKFGNIVYESLFASWWEFLNSAADKLDKEKIALNRDGKSQKAITIRTLLNDSPVDYLDIAQRAFDSLGTRHWYDLIKDNFEKDIALADEASKKLAALIWQLGSNLIVTTNIDLVLQSIHSNPARVKVLDTQVPEYAELQKDWKPARPTVLHLHGHVDNAANIVFTEDQYQQFYDLDKNRAKLETLRSLFTQRTILFIGFSLDDLHILKELERVNLLYEGGANRFFALIRESEKSNPNIPSYVHQIKFSEFGKPLQDLIEELVRIANNGDDDGDDTPKDDETNLTTKVDFHTEKPFFNVPYNSKGSEFVGRTGKIDEIRRLLDSNGCASIGQAVSVKGFGGMGKTQLAVEYSHEYRDKYKNGVFWVVADESIDNQLLQIADKMNWINQYDKTVNQLDVAKAKFLQLSDCLILFDNVESYADIKDYLPELNRQTHALITSRETISKFRPVNLELLERDESRELLLKISNRNPQDEIEKEHLEKILETLGDIPLAIELVGGYLAEHETVTFAKYHQYLDEVPLDKLEKEFPEGSFTGHDRSIIQTLRISEKTIKEKPLMVEILKILAWSGSSSMGISLLKSLVEADSDFEFDTALGDAHRLRLLKKDEKDERYAIHRLLAKVIRYEKPLKKQIEWIEKIAKNLEVWFKGITNRFENLVEFEIEIEHLEVWHEQIIKVLPAEAIILTQLRGNVPRQRGNYRIAFDWFQKAVTLFESKKSDNKKLFADLMNDLGSTYGELGNHQEALKCKQKALEIAEKLFGVRHHYTATLYNNVGITYGESGKHREALKYQMKALKLREELFSEEHPETAISYNNIGSIYGELNDHQEALRYKQKAVKLIKELFGEKHPNTATTYNNIGLTYGALGNYQEALKYTGEALEIQKELFGDNHPSIATTYNNFGLTYGALGNHQEALRYKEKALEIQKELFGDNHPDTARSYNNVASTYGKLGRHEEAVNYKEKALKIHQELLGKQHPNTIIIVINLINTYSELGDKEKAGKKAAEFFNYIPQNHHGWKAFEQISRPYRKKKNRHKKR